MERVLGYSRTARRVEFPSITPVAFSKLWPSPMTVVFGVTEHIPPYAMGPQTQISIKIQQ